jgi:acyl carrier protein
MYRTGDLAKWTADGRLVRTGCADDQAPAPEGPVSPARQPATAEEEALCGLFAEVLGVDRVGPESSFFDLGADSLMAPQLVARIRAELGADVTLLDLLEQPTVAGLAVIVGQLRA